MILTEYDEEKTMRLFAEEYKAEGRAEGLAEGEAKGRTEGRAEGRAEVMPYIESAIVAFHDRGYSLPEISLMMNIPEKEVSDIWASR